MHIGLRAALLLYWTGAAHFAPTSRPRFLLQYGMPVCMSAFVPLRAVWLSVSVWQHCTRDWPIFLAHWVVVLLELYFAAMLVFALAWAPPPPPHELAERCASRMYGMHHLPFACGVSRTCAHASANTQAHACPHIRPRRDARDARSRTLARSRVHRVHTVAVRGPDSRAVAQVDVRLRDVRHAVPLAALGHRARPAVGTLYAPQQCSGSVPRVLNGTL